MCNRTYFSFSVFASGLQGISLHFSNVKLGNGFSKPKMINSDEFSDYSFKTFPAGS